MIARALRAAAATLLAAALSTAAPTPGVAGSVGEPYGTRDPRLCPDRSQPASGPITTDLATAYVICAKEMEYRQSLVLVYGITVQVGRGRPYQDSDRHLADIDPDQLVYPIRGGIVSYSCNRVSAFMQNAGKNCSITAQPNATGLCYKTAFGDWDCNMLDPGNLTNVIRRDMPPPS